MSDLTHLLNRLLGEKVVLHLRQGAINCHVRADQRQVEQVIMHLVVNAAMRCLQAEMSQSKPPCCA